MRRTTYLTDEPVRLGPLLFLRSVSRILASPPLWLVPTGLLLLLALPIGLSWRAFFREATAHRYHPDRVVAEGEEAAQRTLEPFLWDDLVVARTVTFERDHREGLDELGRATAQGGAVLAVLALLVGMFSAGGWLQVILQRTRGHSVRRFFLGGARYFFRFLRLFVLSLALFAAWQWLIYGPLWDELVLGRWRGIPASDWKDLATLPSERAALALRWLRDGVHALGFGLILAWGTFTRTRMALLDASSVLVTGFLTGFSMLRHPLKTLSPLVSLFGLELLLVGYAGGRFTTWLEEGLAVRPSMGLVAAMALVGALALMVREILRGARYHSAVKVSQSIVRPPKRRPDPWRSFGPPGGPQYPVDGDDGSEYVAM